MSPTPLPSATPAPAAPLRWPPPGLERLQGDLWRIAGRGALAGGLLVLPILFVAARTHALSSLGPFGDAWWVTLVLAALGLGFAVDALSSAARLLRRVSDALEHGYDAATVLQVLADVGKDMGFLLQGTRQFSVLTGERRARVARLRVLAASCHAAAGLWLPVALAAALFLAAWGVLGPGELWGVTLLPGVALHLVGGVLGAVEDREVRGARKLWFRQPWARDLDGGEIEAWRLELASRLGREAGAGRATTRAGALRRAAVATGALVVLVALPVLTLVPSSAVGPLLAMVALPRFSRVQRRAAEVEAYRAYRLEPDPALGPEEAGRLLHVLLHTGAARAVGAGEQEPAVRYSAPWLPALESRNPVGAEPHRWPEELFQRVTADPSPALVAFLDSVAAHPAHAELSRLARAAELDAAGARWTDPLPAGMGVLDVPVPRFASLREAGYAHLAAAAADLAHDRPGDAETKIREVISVGLLVGDQGPTLLENLTGHAVAAAGGTALERFYAAVGRDEDARRIREVADAAARAAERIHEDAPAGIEAVVRSLPGLVRDTAAVRGLRWEAFIQVATLTPCLNLNRMVFGPGDDYRTFLADARRSLVRWPSEEQLFRTAQEGFWGSFRARGTSLFGRFLGISMRSGEGSCGDVLSRFGRLRGAG